MLMIAIRSYKNKQYNLDLNFIIGKKISLCTIHILVRLSFFNLTRSYASVNKTKND